MSRKPIPAEAFDHGDPKRYRRGCRCQPCKRGVTAEVRRVRYLRDTGRTCTTTTDKASHRLALLRAAGMSDREIQKAGRLAPDVFYRIARREGHILRDTENRLLAIKPPQDGTGSGTRIPGLGTVRRLRALAADGWTATELGRRVGKHKQFIVYLQNQDTDIRVRMWVADYVTQLCQEVESLRPEDFIAPHIVARTKNTAAGKGWTPTAYWDPEDYDDPSFTPAVDRTPRYIVLAENGLELEDQGYIRQHAAERLGVSKDALQQAISRYRTAQAEQFEAAA